MSDGVLVSIVVGPKTRLGRELIERSVARGEPVVAVARDADDLAALDDTGATVLIGASGLPTPADTLRIFVCALGPVHPTEPGEGVDQTADSASIARDLAVIDGLLAAAPSAHVVLVSTVLALAPRPERRYYGGWKCVVEQQLSELAQSHGADFSVLYPGRLVTEAEVRRPWHRTHTRYARLAAAAEKAASAAPASRVLGLDARLWLLLRGLAVMVSSLTGSGGSTPIPAARLEAPRTHDERISR